MRSVMHCAQNDNNDLVEAVSVAIERALGAELATAAFARREQAALAVANEAVRRLLERELQRLADSEGDEIEYDGIYRRHQPGEAKYHSL